jgi:Outer membrane protein beta-barrel domain
MKFKLVMICFALVVPLSAFAQTVQFGAGIQSSLLNYNHRELDTNKLFWGGHARIRVMKYFAGEASLQRREDTFSVHHGEIALETTPLQFSAMVFPLAHSIISPYFLAGTGWYFLKATVTGDLGLPYVSGNGTIIHTENASHIGVGVEGFVGNHFSVGGDVRKIFLTFNTDIIQYKFDAYFVNIGATFYF